MNNLEIKIRRKAYGINKKKPQKSSIIIEDY